ncbi:ABC transporter substrate-binding protein [Ancrocorticia populi]|uniref:ABC transporter substrate-binding protein n=1 Tax=Ancrocorticia populi TaxID=2175228 RepID=UPI003F98DCA0
MNRHIFKGLSVIAAGGLMFTLSACGGDSDDSASASDGGAGSCPSDLSDLTVGFVAVGPEGGWRDANENNIQKEFKDAGATLKYSGTADNDQANQLKAFSSFVDEEVDLILLSATEATGWENSLMDAQEAEIPVILIDRMIDPDEPDLYVQRLAPNNQEVAANAAKWANEELPDGGNYVVLEGPTGVSVVNERNEGWDSAIDDKFNKLEAQTANWSTEEGKSVFASMLNSHNKDIQLVFAQNDEMGLGAVQAVEEAGLTPGEDVKIITIDGTTPALQALVDGKLSLVAEYNPIFGADAVDTALSALCGEDVEKNYVVESAIYDSVEDAQAAIDDPDRGF